MSTVTDNDLTQVKELISQLSDRINDRFNQIDNRFNQVEIRFNQIDNRFNQVETRFNQIDEKITELRINQTELQTPLNDWKPSIDKTADLSEKIGELRNWKQIAIVLLTGFITSVFWIFRDKI